MLLLLRRNGVGSDSVNSRARRLAQSVLFVIEEEGSS